MANQTSEPGEEFTDQVILDDASLDELSLDDDALFADLDNEIRLDGEDEPAAATGAEDALDDLNLDLDEESLGQMEVQADQRAAPPTAEGLEDNFDDFLGTGAADDGLDDLLGDSAAGNGLDGLMGGPSAGDGVEGIAAEDGEPETLDINAFSEELNLDEGTPADEGVEEASENLDSGDLDLDLEDADSAGVGADSPEVDAEEIAQISVESLDLPDEPALSFDMGEEGGSEDEFLAAPDMEVSDSDLHLDNLGFPAVEEETSYTEDAETGVSDFDSGEETFTAVEDLDLVEDVVLELDSQFLEDAHGRELEPDYTDFSAQDASKEIPVTPPPAATTEIRDIRARAAPRGHEPRVSAGSPALPVGISSEILLSIPHEVNVEMGSVTLNGKDILELNYGSVVQLNRTLGEPVDLVLEGRQIAQGEIVLINGKNLGVRIVAVTK